MIDLEDADELTAIRQTVMEQTWRLIKSDNIKFGDARARAVSEVAEFLEISPKQLQDAWIRNMVKKGGRKPSRPTFEVEKEGRPAFQHDFIDDTPMEDVLWLKNELANVIIGEAVFVLLDTLDEAEKHKKNVPQVVRMLKWRNRRNNPGYYAEIIPVGKHFKLRIKRLR